MVIKTAAIVKQPPAAMSLAIAAHSMADVDCRLRRIWSRNQICDPEQMDQLLGRKPPASADKFLLPHRDMRGRNAESGQSASYEQPRNVAADNRQAPVSYANLGCS